MKFALRKIEKFVKTVAIELHVNSEETGENEVYAPRSILLRTRRIPFSVSRNE